MKLLDLCGRDDDLATGAGDLEISGLTADSRAVKPGFLFAALPGSQADGAKFIPAALENGAVAILAPAGKDIGDTGDAVVLRDEDPRRRLALMAANFAETQPGTIVAVTGTNGKTSVASFVRQIWAALGHDAASLGTVGIQTEGPSRAPTHKKLSHTTPEPVELHKELAELARSGITHLAMEASSHGLEQRRLDGVTLTASAFTNISRDHLDYHASFEDYLHQKLRLFSALDYKDPAACGVVDADSEGAEAAIGAIKARGLTPFTIGRKGTGIRLISAEADGFAQKLQIEYGGEIFNVRLPLVGAFQVSNALVAAGLAIQTGENPGQVFAVLEKLKGAKGRLEHVGTSSEGAPIFIDYAHTPDALSNALAALRPYAKSRLIVVFGCGGDRDKGKRPQMGAAAVDAADVVIVTDDNPRSEDPATIRAEILTAAEGAIEIGDRAVAIKSGIEELAPGDVLLIAGKGHETGQIIGQKIIHFSDHEAVSSALGEAPNGAEQAMGEPLWRLKDIVAATGGQTAADGDTAITSISIDTRTLEPGALFVAIKGDRLDGHDYVAKAFEEGAAAALVDKDFPGEDFADKLIVVDDTLEALNCLGICARARTKAKVIAVTGSVGKTGTKELLRLSLSEIGKTHASQKSYNNHWGVPLSLALMPADCDFAVFEVGMNHPGEITPLTKMIRPDIAIITTVEPVHIGFFSSLEGIAEAKAEIFQGLKPGGIAILNGDNSHFDLLKARAEERKAKVIRFGVGTDADISVVQSELGTEKSTVEVNVKDTATGETDGTAKTIRYVIGAPGLHHVTNSLAVVGTLSALEVDLDKSLRALKSFSPPAGRGTRVTIHLPDGPVNVIDESYNANPASMKAAFSALAQTQRSSFPRRIVVLGDMLELGDHASALHRELADPIVDAGIDLVLACGPHMAELMDALPEEKRGAYATTSEALEADLLETIRAGDAVMIKGSLGSHMSPLVKALCEYLTEQASETLAN